MGILSCLCGVGAAQAVPVERHSTPALEAQRHAPGHAQPSTPHSPPPLTASRVIIEEKVLVHSAIHTGTKPGDRSAANEADDAMQALVHLQRELSLTAGHSLLARTERVLGVLCSFLSASDIRLYGAVDTDEHPGAAPFILIASSGAPPVATATAPTSPSLRGAAAPLAPGTEAWPASMMPVAIATAGASRSQLPIGGSGGCDGGSCAALEMDEHSLGIGELPTPGALRASLPRALAPAQQAASFKMLRQHETQAGRPSVACTGRSQQHPAAGAALPSPQSQLGVRLTPPEPLPALLDRMLQTQAPVFSTRPAPEAPTGGGGGVRGSASGDTAGAAEGDVVILIPLTSGRRILGALWVVRYSGVAATLAAAAAAAAAAASAAASAATATSSGVGATSSPQVPQAGATTSGRAVLEFSRRMQQAPVAAPVVVNTTIGGAGALSFATSSSIPSSGPALLASPPPPALPPAAACYNLLTSPMALQQLSMSLSLLLGADAAPLAGLAGCLAALAGAASVTSLVGALADALAAHVRERYLLEPRVVAAYVPEPSSAVGLLFGGGGGGGAGRNGHGSLAFGGAADAVETAAGAVLSGHHAKDSFKQPPSTQGNAAASKVAGMDARRAGAAAAARVAQIVDGAATRVRSETTARQIRRVPAGSFAADASGGGGGGGRGGGSSFQHGTASSRALATHADLCFPDPLMYSGGNAVFATGPGGYGSNRGPAVAGGLGTAASASRVVALSNVDVAAIDATAAAGSGVTTVRVKPFPLNNTLLRQLVRKQAADTAAAAAKLQQQPRQQAQQQPSAVASSSSGGGNDARAAARGAAAVEVPDCAAHMQDARMPSRDLLMLLTSLSAAAGGAAIGGGAPSSAASVLAGAGASGSAAFVGHSMSQSQLTTQQQRSGPYGSGGGMGGGGGLRSLLLVALPAGDGRGVLAFYVAFPQQLPPPLLREIRGALSEVLDCASALVARKVSRELAAELETLATAAPGASYAVVQDHRVPELVDPEHGTGRGGGGNQEPMTAPANVVGSPAGGGSGSSMSAAFASSAAGLRGLAAGARSVGGMRAGGGGGGGGGGGTGTGGGGGGHTSTAIPEDATDRLDPLLASLEPAFLYETGRTDRSGGEGEGGRFGRTNSAALHAAGGAIALLDASGSARGARRPGAAEAPGTPTAGSRAASGNVGRVALAMLAAANATAGGGAAESAEMAALSPFRGGNQNGGMMPPACGSPGVNEAGLLLLGPMPPSGCPGMYTRSTSVVHMEEMDPVQSTMRAQLPLLVASLQTSISNARSEAALLQAAATALLPRSGPIAVVPSHGGGGGSSGAVPMASAASGPAGVSGRQSHLAPSNGPSHAAGQSDMDQLQLVSQLGVGGCAVVFKGRLGTLDCAVKLMEMPDVDEELRPATGMTGSTHVSGDALTGGAVAPQAAAGGEAAAAAAADEEAAERERVMARRAMLRNAMELAAMQMISHPNVMQVHSTFTNVTLGRRAAPDGAEHFFLRPAGEMELSPEAPPICVAIVCEWCDQACLATALHKRVFPVTLGRLAPTAQNPRGPRVYDFKGIMMTLLDVAMALRHLHANHLIHRDIKPANILLKTNTMDRRGFTAKLADFGFVTLLNRPGDELSGGEPFVAVEESCGTVTHMAPECWSKPCRLDASCDVYSFGILMWELLAGGVRPYPEIEPQDIRKHVCKGLRPVFEGAVPAPYKQLAQRCWSADPLQRPRSSELVAAISQLLSTIGGGGGGGGGGAAGR